jgi:hypothetical protein
MRFVRLVMHVITDFEESSADIRCFPSQLLLQVKPLTIIIQHLDYGAVRYLAVCRSCRIVETR